MCLVSTQVCSFTTDIITLTDRYTTIPANDFLACEFHKDHTWSPSKAEGLDSSLDNTDIRLRRVWENQYALSGLPIWAQGNRNTRHSLPYSRTRAEWAHSGPRYWVKTPRLWNLWSEYQPLVVTTDCALCRLYDMCGHTRECSEHNGDWNYSHPSPNQEWAQGLWRALGFLHAGHLHRWTCAGHSRTQVCSQPQTWRPPQRHLMSGKGRGEGGTKIFCCFFFFLYQ